MGPCVLYRCPAFAGMSSVCPSRDEGVGRWGSGRQPNGTGNGEQKEAKKKGFLKIYQAKVITIC